MEYQPLSYYKTNLLRFGMEDGAVFQHMIKKFYPTDTALRSRNRDLFVLRYCGTQVITYKKLGEKFGISGQRARQIASDVRYRINKNIKEMK